MSDSYDITIVGAGMAGASLAAELAPHASVLLLEAESHPGYHATGRSAAFWTESYGGRHVQPLTTASGAYLRTHGFLAERGALTIARSGREAALRDFAGEFGALGVRVELLDRAALEARLPGLRPEWTIGALEPDCSDIDVAGLHQHYLTAAARLGAAVECKAVLASAVMSGTCWSISLTDGRSLSAGLLIDAAGAWADQVAKRSGVKPLGIAAYRRTVMQLRTAPPPPGDLPLVLDLDESFYFKPEGARLWLSPHDETASPPCDAAPEELDIAVAIDRFAGVVDWRIEQVEHKWAGLRSFAPDRLPVYGFAADRPRFFWFAGQGGFGIQTAPAAAEVARRLICGEVPGDVDPAPYSPARFG